MMLALEWASKVVLMHEKQHSRRMAIIYALASQVFFMAMFTCVGLMRKGYSIYQIIQGRVVIGFIFNYLFCYVQNIPIYPKTYFQLKLMVLRGVLGGIAMLLVFNSFKLLNMSDAVVVTNTYPLFTCFLAVYFLDEKISKKAIFFSFLSFIGIVLIVKPAFLFGSNAIQLEGRNQFLGCISGLLSSFCMSFVLILMRKIQYEQKCNNAQLLMFSHFFTPLISGLAQVDSPFNEFKMTPFYIVMIIIIAISGFTAQILYSRSFTLEQASLISPLQYTQVIISFFVDIFFFHETLSITSIFGSIFVVIGSVAILI